MKGTIKNMTYYKKIKRDKAREKHIQEMDKIKYRLRCQMYDRQGTIYWQRQLLLMEKQLRLYDKEMGYKKEL